MVDFLRKYPIPKQVESNKTIHSFSKNLKKANDPALRPEWEKGVKRAFENKCKFRWKDDMVSQLDFKCDAWIQTKNGVRHLIDVKHQNPRYFRKNSFVLELKNDVYDNQDLKSRKFLYSYPGWMYSSPAKIFYGNFQEKKLKELFGFSIYPFKKDSFNSKLNTLSQKEAYTTFPNKEFQITTFAIASRQFIEKNTDFSYYWRKDN